VLLREGIGQVLFMSDCIWFGKRTCMERAMFRRLLSGVVGSDTIPKEGVGPVMRLRLAVFLCMSMISLLCIGRLACWINAQPLICQSWQQPQHGRVARWLLHVSAIGQDGESII